MITLSEAVVAVAHAVAAAREDLNRLDAVAGDGDLGITMSVAAQAAIEAVVGGDNADTNTVLRRIGMVIARRAPSTGGTLVATALVGASRVPSENEAVVRAIARRARAAQLAIEERGGAKVGDKSMLDALSPAVESFERDAEAEVSVSEALAHAALAAREGARETEQLTPRVGRAAWLAARSHGVEDGGAHLVAIVFEAIADTVSKAESNPARR
jgi:dihydroxyacetone kinase